VTINGLVQKGRAVPRLALIAAMMLAVSGCGIKSDLLMPDGKATPKSQRDPSRPPQPIGR